MPRRSSKNAGAGDVVEGPDDQAQIREHIAHEWMLENREAGDDEGELSLGERVDELIAMRLLGGKHPGKPPRGGRRRQGGAVIRDPTRVLVLWFVLLHPH